MKKLLQKYVEIYPDGRLSAYISELIKSDICDEEHVDLYLNAMYNQNVLDISDEVANFENLRKAYKSI